MSVCTTPLSRLSRTAVAKVSGDAWAPLRPLFMELSQDLLAVSQDAQGELTTIYVRFTVTTEVASPAYSVIWIKSIKQLVVGLALPPASINAAQIVPCPKGYNYKGLTAYFVLKPGDQIPENFDALSVLAYNEAKRGATG